MRSFGEAEVGANASSPTRSRFVGVAVVPNSSSRSLRSHSTCLRAGAFDFEDQGRALQVSVLAVEVIAGGGIADERPSTLAGVVKTSPAGRLDQ